MSGVLFLGSNMKKIYLVMVTVLFLALTSCGAVKEFVKSPTVAVKGANLQNLSATGGTINFSLAVKNPNAFAIKTNGLDYGLMINGIKVVNGALNNKISLPANGVQTMQLPVKFGFANIKELIPNILSSRKLDYKLGGSIHTPLLNLPFSKSGKLGM